MRISDWSSTCALPICGIPVKVEGKAGVVFRKSPERDAFDRWQQGRFLEVERVFAQRWRADLANIDLSSITKAWKSILKSEDRPKTHAAARDLARRAVDAGGQNSRILRMAHNLLGMHPHTHHAVRRKWKATGPT